MEFYNYNAYYSSFYVIWSMAIQNDWYLFMDAGVKATGTSWAEIYFILIVITFDLFVLNIITAFVLQAYQAQSKGRLYVTGDVVEGETSLAGLRKCEVEEVLPERFYRVF
eukprot:UN06647